MKKGEDTRVRIITAAAALLDEHGYHGTGINAVLASAGAPRGSLYFHFPDGKDAIVSAALFAVGAQLSDHMEQAFAVAATPAEALDAVFGFFRSRLIETGYRCGCPISTVSLEVSGSGSPVADTCAQIYNQWQMQISQHLQYVAVLTPAAARHLAVVLLSLIEGALLLSRSQRSTAALDAAQTHAVALLSLPIPH
jgi:TetR/AcrR family transcriptional repressor of lmrAB and yxaGH operons